MSGQESYDFGVSWMPNTNVSCLTNVNLKMKKEALSDIFMSFSVTETSCYVASTNSLKNCVLLFLHLIEKTYTWTYMFTLSGNSCVLWTGKHMSYVDISRDVEIILVIDRYSQYRNRLRTLNSLCINRGNVF